MNSLYASFSGDPAFHSLNTSQATFSTNNIALFLLLADKNANGKQFVIGTTHLYWDEEYTEVKVFQALALQLALYRFSGYSSVTTLNLSSELFPALTPMPTSPLPVLLLGDFNAQPQGPVYELITTGQLSSLPAKLKVLLKEQNEPLVLSLFNIGVTMSSAYREALGKEPDFTHWVPHFHGCLDYLFYKHFKVLRVLNMPPESSVSAGLPNDICPSDHISAIADFTWPSVEDEILLS